MKVDSFKASISKKEKPENLRADLAALWYDGIGDWDTAHEIAQKSTTPNGDRIHAYLHRKEGDQFNARYWYNRCGEEMPVCSLDEEWEKLVSLYSN
ncbi:MAG: hypothetical protein JXR07_19495 [Reichenbachiella sp.]